MKNIKRLFLLATLIIIATVIFESDFEKLKTERNNAAVAVNE